MPFGNVRHLPLGTPYLSHTMSRVSEESQATISAPRAEIHSMTVKIAWLTIRPLFVRIGALWAGISVNSRKSGPWQ